MQIHELNSFVGTPGAGDYLAIDDGSETTKVEASNLGVTTQMTQAEAEAGTGTGSRVITPKVLNNFVGDYVRDMLYPVGSYYETTDANFDPSTEWGGTWTLVSSKDAYIVDEGSSGNWTYRKWSNGTSECWLDYTEPTAQAFSASGNVFFRVISGLNFPSGTFISAPVVQASVYFANVGGCAISNLTSTTCGVTALSAVSGARAVTVKLYAKGKWKNTSETYYRWHRTA